MKNTVLARRYAKALFELANEKGKLKEVAKEVDTFAQNLRKNQKLKQFVHAQNINRKKKQEVFESLLRGNVSAMFCSFFMVLLKKNRESLFSSIAAEFTRIVDHHNRIVHALTVSALPLDSQLKSNLKSILDRRFDADVQINSMVDETLLGGIVINVEGQVFDGSLHSQLMRLKSQLKESADARKLNDKN